MPRISFDGFKDPTRRPRYIVWTLVALLVLAAVMIVALGVTSTRWFCAEGCHKVQDDTIKAYQRSSHSEISCMSCHMPVGASPVIFVLHKAEALGELYLTVTDNFELPLNGESEVALTMPATQCTQCHNTQKRNITPASGVKIDHDVHAKKEVTCAICHNRIAHKEDFPLTLTDPKTGKKNRKHENFSKMTACFRCHSQNKTPEGGLEAPGKCLACHTADFELKPESHREPGFFPKGHAKLAKVEASRVAVFDKVSESKGKAEGEAENSEAEGVGPGLVKVESLNECYTCHAESFCVDCHGVPMPHPAQFREKHGAYGKKAPKVCAKCHGSATGFCNECHHGTSIGWNYDPAMRWRVQHPGAVANVGASTCFQCHAPTYCADCHVNGARR